MPIGRPDQRDIYMSAVDADSFRTDYRANPNADDPNVVLRIADGPVTSTDKFVPPIVAMLDLLAAASMRAATEALGVLHMTSTVDSVSNQRNPSSGINRGQPIIVGLANERFGVRTPNLLGAIVAKSVAATEVVSARRSDK